MNAQMPKNKRLVIVGASGMVGGYALRYSLENPAVASVLAIGRRQLGISHPKLKEVLHQDFNDCSPLAEPLASQDAAIFCLGAYTGAVSDRQLRTVTVDYPIEFARVLHLSSPSSAFSFLSGSGADQLVAVEWPSRATRERLNQSCSRRNFSMFIYSALHTFILWSRVKSRISATAFCARSIRVSSSVSQSGSQSGRLGPSDGRCCRCWNRSNSSQVFENRDIRALIRSLDPLRVPQRKVANDTTPRPKAAERGT